MLDRVEDTDRDDKMDVIRIVDRFVLQHRFPDGMTVVDRFVAARKDLPAAEREMLLGWRDPVEGIFEVQRKDGDAIILLNLIDDLVYRTYSNVGREAFYPDYGALRDLFADPALAADQRYGELLRAYLRAETITPLPLRRLAAAHPETVDAVYRKILRKPGFAWAEHGDALLRKRKSWYYERERCPGVSVIGARLNELAAGGR